MKSINDISGFSVKIQNLVGIYDTIIINGIPYKFGQVPDELCEAEIKKIILEDNRVSIQTKSIPEKDEDAMADIIRADTKEWLDVTGCLPEGTSYYYECMGIGLDSSKKLVEAGYGNIWKAQINILHELEEKIKAKDVEVIPPYMKAIIGSHINEMVGKLEK